nr:hypothetical protein [Tanacetum cinerariifolium]
MVEYSQKWHNGTSRIRSTKTSDGLVGFKAQLNNLGREIKKVNEKVYAAQVGCEQCKGPHYTKDCSLKEEGKTLEEAYYTQFGVPFQQEEQYKATALGFYQRNNANPSYQERRQSMEESLRKFISESAKRHEENFKLIKEIRASTDTAIRNPGALIKTLEILSGKMSKINNICYENALADLGASVSVMPLSTYLNLGLDKLTHTKLTVELADRTVKHLKGIAENVLVRIGKFVFPIDFIILDMPEDVKVPLILKIPFLSATYAKIDVFKRNITLRVGDEKIVFKSMKPASSLIKRVYMLSLRERMKIDLEARLMGETLVLNSSLDPLYRDYIELNDLNVPLELRRDQVDDFMPTIKEGELIDKPMIDIIKTRNNESFDEYPSFCDFDRKIHTDWAYNLIFSCMIVMENMDGYRDQDMGDVIFGEPFCKASYVEARKFNGLITIHNGMSILSRRKSVPGIVAVKGENGKKKLLGLDVSYMVSFFIIAVQTPGSGISILLAVGTPSTGSGNLYCQWELSHDSGNALCILFPTEEWLTRGT